MTTEISIGENLPADEMIGNCHQAGKDLVL
jgi:hypothetical protein